MSLSLSLAGCALAGLIASIAPVSLDGDVEAITHEYLHKSFDQRDVDAMFDLMSDDVAFIDPTAELWGGPASAGVQGKDMLRKLVASWNIVEAGFEIEHSFFTGPYAVYVGKAMWHSPGQPPMRDLPFCTILKVEDGQITERRDYGDYDVMFPKAQEREGALAEAADRYFGAYGADDPKTMEGLLDDYAVYLDPTRATLGKPLEVRGKYEILAMVEQAAGSAPDLEIDVRLRFYSNRHALYATTARYTVDGAEYGAPGAEWKLEHPVVHVLEFREGKVVEHRRYLDYAGVRRQIEQQRG